MLLPLVLSTLGLPYLYPVKLNSPLALALRQPEGTSRPHTSVPTAKDIIRGTHLIILNTLWPSFLVDPVCKVHEGEPLASLCKCSG